MRREVAIVGVAQAALEHGRIPHAATPLSIQALVAKQALRDAGLTFADVDGMLTSGTWAVPGPGVLPSVALGEYLRIRPRFMDTTSIGGASFESHVAHAAMAIEHGYCDVALITYGSLQKSERSRSQSGRPPLLNMQFETPWGVLNPIGSYAMAAMRHMHEFGTTPEQLAHVAVSTRQWAQRNPEATMREPIDVDDVLRSPLLSDPLHLLDCCLITDGAAALVLTSAEHARSLDVTPVHVAGYGEAQSHWTISEMEDLTVTPAVDSGRRAMEMAGIGPDAVDVLQVYDSFTITALLAVEDLGFCEKGAGGEFFESGATAPGGELPTNTQGGGLSYAHPGLYGLFLLVEAVRQLRGEAGERQVPQARVALVNGTGGVLSTAATCVLTL